MVFFKSAVSIVNQTDRPYQTKTAMINILNGCVNTADVLEKQGKFFAKLDSLGIKCDKQNLYIDEKYNYNLDCDSVLDELIKQYGTKYSPEDLKYCIKILNKINFLREGPKERFSDAKFFLITANGMYLNVASNSKVLREGLVPLTSTVEFLTEKLWIKTNRSLVSGRIKSIDVITKSQLVISSQMNIAISEKFNEVNQLYREEKISITEANAVLSQLKKFRSAVEQVTPENVDDAIIFTDSSIDKYMDEHKYLTKVAKDANAKNSLLQKRLDEKEEKLKSYEERDAKSRQRKIFLITFFKRISIFAASVILLLTVYILNSNRDNSNIIIFLYCLGTFGSVFGILRFFGIDFTKIRDYLNNT